MDGVYGVCASLVQEAVPSRSAHMKHRSVLLFQHFGAVMGGATMRICAGVSVVTHVFGLLGYIPGMGLLGHMVVLCLASLRS